MGHSDMRWAATYAQVFQRAASPSAAAVAGWDSVGETDVLYPADADAPSPAAGNGSSSSSSLRLEIVVAHRTGWSLDTAQADLGRLLNLSAISTLAPSVTLYVKGDDTDVAALKERWAFAPQLNVIKQEDVGGAPHVSARERGGRPWLGQQCPPKPHGCPPCTPMQLLIDACRAAVRWATACCCAAAARPLVLALAFVDPCPPSHPPASPFPVPPPLPAELPDAHGAAV